MTTLTFHLSRALARSWGPGDEVVVTELDHHANIDPWRALEKERGVTVRSVRLVPEEGRLDEDELVRALSPRTKLLAIGAAANALGTINDVRRFADAAHAFGALVFVDAVHYAPHALVDVRALGADFLACSAYKFYGPHVGVLYGRRDLLDEPRRPEARPLPRRRAGSRRDRHAEPRGHRGGGGRRRLSRFPGPGGFPPGATRATP